MREQDDQRGFWVRNTGHSLVPSHLLYLVGHPFPTLQIPVHPSEPCVDITTGRRLSELPVRKPFLLARPFWSPGAPTGHPEPAVWHFTCHFTVCPSPGFVPPGLRLRSHLTCVPNSSSVGVPNNVSKPASQLRREVLSGAYLVPALFDTTYKAFQSRLLPEWRR